METVVFGGGCFWCTEAFFKELKGVTNVMSGYSGGTTENPTYKEVSSGSTGHAEAIRIEYDSEKITFKDLLTVFFATHDPTTLNQQGSDVGTQYRSVIFYTNENQKEESEAFIDSLNTSNRGGENVVTEVTKFEKFYEAEDYHKNYFANNEGNNYCQVVINPKLEKVKKEFANLVEPKKN